jgi:hypothetical protein
MTPAIARQVVAVDFSCAPLLGAGCVALPWIIIYFGGPDLYLYILVGFALIMMFLNRRELLVRVQNWRAALSRRN